MDAACKALFNNANSTFLLGLDLNPGGRFYDRAEGHFAGTHDEPGQAGVRAVAATELAPRYIGNRPVAVRMRHGRPTFGARAERIDIGVNAIHTVSHVHTAWPRWKRTW